MSIDEKLAFIRKHHKSSDIAFVRDLMGCSPNYIRMILNGNRQVRSDRSKKIVHALMEVTENRLSLRKKYGKNSFL